MPDSFAKVEVQGRISPESKQPRTQDGFQGKEVLLADSRFIVVLGTLGDNFSICECLNPAHSES